MIETAAAIDPAASSPGSSSPAAQTAKETREDIAGGFSFSAAMTALEGRASQSLKTFGAAPQGSAPGASPATSSSNTPVQTPHNEQQPAEAAAADPKTPRTAPPTPQTQNPERPVNAAVQAPLTAPPLPAAALITVQGVAIAQQAPPAVTRIENATLRGTDGSKPNGPKAPPLAQSQQAQPATQDFAKLLARRLGGGATSFDLRLDPPELGRVEANLRVADDGEAVLALKFENQSALDMFARDEAGLRNALLSSGFDLGRERLAFSLADELPAPGEKSESSPHSITEAYEPLFLAPFSHGVVDLRV